VAPHLEPVLVSWDTAQHENARSDRSGPPLPYAARWHCRDLGFHSTSNIGDHLGSRRGGTGRA